MPSRYVSRATTDLIDVLYLLWDSRVASADAAQMSTAD